MLKFDFNLGEQKVKFELMKQCAATSGNHTTEQKQPQNLLRVK